MKTLLGNEFDAFVESLERPSPTSVRMNPRKRISKFEEEEKVSWCVEGRYLKERPSFTFDPMFHAGAYYVQEASSMFLEAVWKQINPQNEPMRVLDMCAAPGGKSTHLLSLMDGKGLLVTNELIPNRNRVLQQNIIKWGYSNCIITQNKAEAFESLGEYFDVVLIDAPCTGEGLFRKDKDAVSEWSEKNVAMCAERQKDILKSAISCLKPGGHLIYSTCTFEPEENDENVEQLTVDNIQLTMEQPGIAKTKFGYQFYPHRVKGEGFYMSVVKKDGDAYENISTGFKPQATKSKQESLHFLQTPDNFTEVVKNDLIFAIPKSIYEDFVFLEKQLYIRNAGICMGTMKGKDFLPSHDLALSHEIKTDVLSVDLTYEEAITYLRGDLPKINSDNRGWTLVKYDGMNLGWVKLLENRLNNYYPKEFRILKK